MGSRQRDILASETSEEREARLQSVRQCREQQLQAPLFEQRAVRKKMRTFHAQAKARPHNVCISSSYSSNYVVCMHLYHMNALIVQIPHAEVIHGRAGLYQP